ncbi:MAG: hypothetical protein R2875_08250 [Desulfobacterales bacterium]
MIQLKIGPDMKNRRQAREMGAACDRLKKTTRTLPNTSMCWVPSEAPITKRPTASGGSSF